jgi:TonB family protein
VQDAAPFSRSCAGDGGCIVQLGSSASAAAAGPGAPTAPSDGASRGPSPGPLAGLPAQTVPLDTLHRRTGEPAIPPGDDARQAAAGKPLGVTIVKVCLTAEGKVLATRLVKSSGVAAYDAQVQRTIQATWTFEPVATGGTPAPVCTQVTFMTHGP